MDAVEPECVLVMGGTRFFVDLANEWIYEVANPANYIPFNELYEDTHEFRMIYDPVTKNNFKGDEDELWQRHDLIYVTIKELKWMPAFGFVWNTQENRQGNKMKR